MRRQPRTAKPDLECARAFIAAMRTLQVGQGTEQCVACQVCACEQGARLYNETDIADSQVPADVVPSLQQLHDDSPDIHPAIVDCLLFLKGSEEVC